jgi:N-acetylneuraminate synthase/pseudaminic acid synthase
MKNIKIGNKIVGVNLKCLVVAEISANHDSKLKNALKLIRSAAQAGVDAVKIQTYKPETITLNSFKKDFLIKKNSPWAAKKNFWNLYKKGHTPWEWHKKLFDEAKKNNIEIFSSPFDETAVDFFEKLGCKAYKIASPEITHTPLIIKAAKTGKPLIISTGLSKLDDLTNAIKIIRKIGNNKIIVLKCTSAYPAPKEELNLKTIEDIAKKFKVHVGFSDHSIGNLSATTAVALGAKVIEKHFKLKNKKSIDDFFSADKSEFKNLISNIRDVEKSLGTINYNVTKSAMRHLVGKRSIYISSQIKKGDFFTKENIKVVRPCYGLNPKYYNYIIGKKSNCNLTPATRLKLSHIKK